METSSSQTPLQPQNQARAEPQPTQQQQTPSSKNLKSWFDEFKARVSKKSQAGQVSSPDQSSALTNEEDSTRSIKEPPVVPNVKKKSSSLRSRRPTKISVADSPDFDAASINTIFDRRDSRYQVSSRRHQKSFLCTVSKPIRWLISYLMPFNYTLPWKLLCILNSSFVIIVIGLASGSLGTSMVFNFWNGFISGLSVAIICFIIVAISFIVHVLPKSNEQKLSSSSKIPGGTPIAATTCDDTMSSKGFDVNSRIEHELSCIGKEERVDEFSMFEILDQENNRLSDDSRHTGKLDDDDYKGWMIEFIGDYELRNTSDIKLKSIFVRIEDGVLYLCKTKNSHDTDSSTLPVFTSQRVYDLNNAQKFSGNLLIPKNVRNKQKYVWSKKYPIRLEFQCEEYVDAKSTTGDNTKQTQLTLFARSCREKEEWFRRFKRIVDRNRLSQANLKRHRKSEDTFESLPDGLIESLNRFGRRSPSPKRDQLQTSRSSHLLSESKKLVDNNDEKFSEAQDCSSPALSRTKSCELLHESLNSPLNQKDESDSTNLLSGTANESTLTKETAEMFSQAIEYSNFLDAQPTLDYIEYIERLIQSGQGATKTSDWFNSLTGRIFFDVFSQNYWSIWFKRKIQRKLYRIRLPYFMETLTLTQIDLGTNAPQFFNVVSHNFDSFGLSIDFDMSYSGGLTMTFETKLNLLKIKSDNSGSATSSATSPGSNSGPGSSQQGSDMNTMRDGSSTSDSSLENLTRDRQIPSCNASTRTSGESSDSDDSDSDSSSDSSIGDADLNEISDWEDYGAEKTRQNIVKFVDKIASSRYFQHATENRYIKKKLQDISNCPLVLVVQIQSLNGILTINVPPPQTDRIWYGFKPTPELVLKAIPKMGDREVSLSHVTDWIERKLSEEFKKILVIPNMEDIVLPVLKSDYLQYVTVTR